MSYRGRGRHGRGGRGYQGGRSSTYVKPAESENAVPILVPGRKTNYPKWIRSMTKEAYKQYGNLARLFVTGEHYVPPALNIDEADLDAPIAPPGQTFRQKIEQETMLTEAKNRTIEMHNLMKDRSKLYALMELHISKLSEEVLKQRPNWAEISASRDPLLLHQAIRLTHLVEASGDPVSDRQFARDNFVDLELKGGSLDDFLQDFQYAVEMLRATGQDGLYDDEALMSEFVNKLDGRFAQFKADLDNQALAGIEKPATYLQAYNRAVRYKIVGAKDTARGYSNNTTLVVAADHYDGRGRGKRGGGRGQRGGRSGGANASSVDEGKEKSEGKRGAANNSDDNNKKKARKEKTCYFCHKPGHYVADCPDIKNNVTGVVLSDQHGDDGFNLMSCMAVTDMESRLVAVGLFDSLDIYDVFLDSGANVSMWKHMDILVDVGDAPPIPTRGIEGTFTATQRGMLPGFFEVSGAPNALWNILSLSECEDRFKRIDYVKGRYYRVWVTDDYYIEFRRRYGVFIGNLREYLE